MIRYNKEYKDYMKILVCLILLSVVLAEPWGDYGLIVNYHISELVNDMLFVFEALLRNVKSYDHKNIYQPIEHKIFTEELFIEDIEVVDMFFNAAELHESHIFDTLRGRLEMSSNLPILKFIYKFNWRADYSSIYEKSGSGLFSATSESLYVAAFFDNSVLNNEVDAKFKFDMVKFDGDNVNDDIKNLINKALKDNIAEGLTKAFISNKDFISKYLFSSYKASYNNYRGDPLVFNNIPTRWESIVMLETRIITMFETEIALKNRIHSSNTNMDHIHSLERDITMAINPDFIFTAIYAMYSEDQFETPIDLKEFGYSGTIEDFYKIDPNLRVRYPRDAKVQVNSTVKSFHYSPTLLRLSPTFVFRFFATDKSGSFNEFANAEANTTIMLEKTIIDKTEKLFGARIVNVTFGLPSYHPFNIETWAFMEIFTGKVFDKVLTKEALKVPKLRYEPIRIYKEMNISLQTEGFSSVYTF